MQIFKLAVICWVLALVVTGCSNSGSLEETRNVHTRDWINPTSPNFHAKSVTSPRNLDSCKTCHGLNLAGNEKIPGCSNCHLIETTAPVNLSDFNNISIPAVSWNHGDSHAELVAFGDTCNACHDSLRAVGQGPGACHDCHGEVGMHTRLPVWLDPEGNDFHGTAAKDNLDNCKSCHGNDLLGGFVGVSCNKCHFGSSGARVPVGQRWEHGTIPHNTLIDDGNTCNFCHDSLRQFPGQGPGACHDCHGEVNQHPLGQTWVDPNGVNFHGNADQSGCALCHGNDFSGGYTNVSCYDCHFGPSGSQVPLNSNWAHPNSTMPATSHAALSPEDGAICNTCHAKMAEFSAGPKICHDCHTHTAITNYSEPAQHAPDAKGSINNPKGLLECVVCHGDPAKELKPNQAFFVGIPNYGCENCHNANTAHPTQPLSGGSNELRRWYDAVTGDLTSGGSHNDVSKTAVLGCYICHPAGASDFALVGPGCLSCHVTDPMQTAKGDCVSCHDNPPDGSTVPNRAGAHANHMSYACSKCHTNDGPDSQDGVVNDPNAVNHFRYPSPQNPDRYFRADVKSDFGSYDASANNFTCVAQCHESKNWY